MSEQSNEPTPAQDPPQTPGTTPEPPTPPTPPLTPATGPTTPTPPADDRGRDDDLRAELEQLRAELNREREEAQEERQRAVAAALAQQRGEQDPAGATKVDLSGVDQDERAERYADWPQRGGGDLPQPWDHRAMGLHGELRDFERDSRPGSPNTVSPIVINHGKPILAHGSSDPSVHELGQILGRLGFPNSVSDGENAFGSVDNTVMAAVHAFRDAYNVSEDPSGWGGNTPDGRARASAHIGPWTWEAVLRAGAQLLDTAAKR
jgi:hypothetical protein